MSDPSLAAARRRRPALALVAVVVAAIGGLAATGCGGDDPPTAVPPAPGPVEPAPNPGTGIATAAPIPILGQGVVTTRFNAEVTVHPAGTHAYTSTWGRRSGSVVGNVVHVWDVRGDRPVLVDSLAVDERIGATGVTTTGDVQVSDDGRLLVVATEPAGHLALYALDDPARPRLVTRWSSPSVASGVHTAQLARVAGRPYVFCAVNPRAGQGARLVIVDVGDPAAPREVWQQAMGDPFVHDVFVRDGVLMTANWNEGLVVWDLGGVGRGGTPTAPVRVGAVRTVAVDQRAGPSVHNVWWLHHAGQRRYAVVGEESAVGLAIGNASAGDVHVVDIGDLTRPETWREVAFLNVPRAGAHNFVADEERGTLYAAFYNGGVRALDLRGDLGACTAGQRAADGRCDLRRMGREIGVALAGTPTTTDPRTGTAHAPFVWGVDRVGAHVYASDMMGGVWKLRALGR